MAPFKQYQRRRRSSGTNASGRGRSRDVSHAASTQSNIRSASRYSSVSRRSSTTSTQDQAQRQAASRRTSTRSERPISVATSRTFAGDDQSIATTEPAPGEFENDVDMLNEVIMAVNLTDRGTVGCAYYVARDEKLYFMEDVRLGGPDVIDACA